MKLVPKNDSPASSRRRGWHGRAQTILLLAIVFLLGIAASAFWFYAASKPAPTSTSGGLAAIPAIQLSAPSREVLHRLHSPLELRYYAVLDPATVPQSLLAFAGRVDQLVSAYEQAGAGQVKVKRFNALSAADTDAAEADGVTAFNGDKGPACYLGVTLLLKGQKESLPRLSPEWEPALESDITRAITRLVDATRPVPAPVVASSQAITNAAEKVRALIPDLATVSVDEGRKIIQQASLQEFQAAAKQSQAQIKEAEQRLSQLQSGASEADRQAAVKQLRQIQAEQTRKLKQIAAEAKAQVDAFEQMKAGAR